MLILTFSVNTPISVRFMATAQAVRDGSRALHSVVSRPRQSGVI